jgi:hypothetical protein
VLGQPDSASVDRAIDPHHRVVEPKHHAAMIAAVHGMRAKLYEKRQQVLNLGADALALLTEITHREPSLSMRRVEAPRR